MPRPFGLVATICCTGVAPVSAQATIAGTWFTEFDAQVRIVNGAQSTVKGHARIELQVSGDSIHGTWQNLNATGTAAGPARALAAPSRVAAPSSRRRSRAMSCGVRWTARHTRR